jgi:hypothetical protein
MKSSFGQQKQSGSLFFSILVLVAACAEGAPAAPVDSIEAPLPMMEATCGNGKMDPGEMCECPKTASTTCALQGMTCDIMMNGTTGLLLCDAKTCLFNTDMCKGPNGGPAGGAGAQRPPTGAGGSSP